jgi:hypothetical protein
MIQSLEWLADLGGVAGAGEPWEDGSKVLAWGKVVLTQANQGVSLPFVNPLIFGRFPRHALALTGHLRRLGLRCGAYRPS